MDEQTADFFAGADVSPDATGGGGEQAADFGGYENIGDVDFAGAPPSDQPPPVMVPEPPAGDDGGMDFASPPSGEETPIILGQPPEGGAPPSDPFSAPADDPFGAVPTEDAPLAALGEAGAPVLVEDDKPESNEPSPMAKFNNEFQDTLRERKDHENSVKADHVEKARAELEAFQAQREKKRESRMAKNRADEQQKLEDLEADLENDNSWQRVVKMVELQQDTMEGAEDKKRMIDVLIYMKNDADRAVALA